MNSQKENGTEPREVRASSETIQVAERKNIKLSPTQYYKKYYLGKENDNRIDKDYNGTGYDTFKQICGEFTGQEYFGKFVVRNIANDELILVPERVYLKHRSYGFVYMRFVVGLKSFINEKDEKVEFAKVIYSF